MVIAGNITNLTDARYFAAWNVQYLAFKYDETSSNGLSIPEIEAIREWVEGPEFLLEINESDADKAVIIADQLKMNGIILPAGTDWPSWVGDLQVFYDLSIDTKAIDLSDIKDSLEKCHAIIASNGQISNNLSLDDIPVWIKHTPEMNMTDIKAVLGNYAGLYVSGGDEEQVGVKSYDDLDDVMEFLAYGE